MNAQFADFPMERMGEFEPMRSLPAAVDAEQAVLGGIMLAPESLAQVSDWLKPEDFYRADHQLIYAALQELIEKKQGPDPVTLGEWFESKGKLDQVDGGGYLIELASTTPSAANVVAYAEIVKGKAQQRKLIEVGQTLVDKGFSPQGEDLSVIVSDATQSMSELHGIRKGSVKGARQIGSRWFKQLQERYERGGELVGLATPWSGFNSLTNGLKDGELIIVAGRPSMGKSAWAVNAATSVAMRGHRVIIFNLEMTDTSIYNRAVASIYDVPLAWLQRPNDEHEEYWSRVGRGVKEINESGLLIDDSSGLTLQQIVARCRRERMKAPIRMVVIDHLHLMPLPGKTRETVEIGHITAGLKALAKELSCPVVLLSQLNRSLETRQNKRPVMADLRESGNIEQDADLIVFMYRDDYYSQREETQSHLDGFVEMIIAKQREGGLGTAWGRNALAMGRIDDYEGTPPPINVQREPAKRGGLS